MSRSKKTKGKETESKPKKPTLCSVKGDYRIPTNILLKYDLNEILVEEARSWTNIEKLIDSFFNNVQVWEQNGNNVFSRMIQNLKDFSRGHDETEAVRVYARKVTIFLNTEDTKAKFQSYYILKEKEATLKRERLLARLQGDTSGVILSRVGAQRFVEEEVEVNARKRKIDQLFEEEDSSDEDDIDEDGIDENSIGEGVYDEDEHLSSFSSNNITVEAEKKLYPIQPPNPNLSSPNRPIIRTHNRVKLKSLFDICLSSDTTTNCTVETKLLFDKFKKDQKNNSAIAKIDNALDLVKRIFTLKNDRSFSKNVFCTTVESSNHEDFIDFIKHSIVDFYVNTKRITPYQTGEERSFFCEVVIPLFKSFGNLCGTIFYRWGEKKLPNACHLWISGNNFNKKGISNNFLDGIGRLNDSISFMLLESSGFNNEENFEHSLNDTIKNLKNGSDVLKFFASNFKNSSFTTLKKIHIYSCQVIQKKITLIQYSIFDSSKWRAVKCRSAEIPTEFTQIKKYIKIYELFAFLYDDIKNQKSIYEELEDQKLGLEVVPEEDTVGFHLS